ncbi:MAG: hypothetical protein FWH21_00660 [Kiritimatiellaeota bacterium]|nr:hypothetical protein [Kiritimatiellota bacterium]
MRNVAVYIIGCLFCACAVRAQETPVDRQFKALSEEIEGWKKEMTRAVASRKAVEMLLRLGVAFQKSYADAADSIVKADLIDGYTRKRDAQMRKLPITLYKCGRKDISLANPGEFVFEVDELEIDAARPLFFLLNGSQDRMLYSYRESQQFINLLAHLMAKARANEQTSIPTRHFVASVQLVNGEATVFLQFLSPEGSVSKDLYRLSEFDARLLAGRISAVLKASPPPGGYREPDDVDPGTTMFAAPADSGDTPPSNFRALECSNFRTSEFSNSRTSEFSNSRTLECSNSRA